MVILGCNACAGHRTRESLAAREPLLQAPPGNRAAPGA